MPSSTTERPVAPERLVLPVAILAIALSVWFLKTSFAPARVEWLAPFGLTLLFLGLRNQGAVRGALLGLLWGALYEGSFLWWTRYYGEAAMVALVCIRTVLPALVCAALASLPLRRAAARAVALACGWVALEYLQSLGPFGMTWESAANAMVEHPVFLQILALTGMWGLSFCLALAGSVLSELCFRRSRALAGLAVVAWVVLPAALAAFGAWRLQQPLPAGQPLRVAVVQVGLSRETKWDPRFRDLTLQRLERLTRRAVARGAHLVVWPETSIPYRGFLKRPSLTRAVARLARDLGIWLVVGSLEGEPGATQNILSLIDPRGAYVGRYDKQRLVPGGEYLPLEPILERLRIFDQVSRHIPGKGDGLLGAGGVALGSLICFESMVPYLAAERVRQGADLLVVATNDSPVGEHPGALHHFDAAVLRAVETGRFVVQAANNGVSGVIDSRGRRVVSSGMDEVTTLAADVQTATEETLYCRIGDGFAWLCLAGFALAWFRQPDGPTRE